MMLNLAWAVGEIIGAPAAANLSQATSDAVPLLALSAIMVLTLRPVIRARLTPAHPSRRRERRRDGARGELGARRGRAVSAAGAHPALMAPIAVGPVTLHNRVVSTSHQTSLVHDHLPTDDLRRLPRGARPRRGGRDLPRGDRHRPHRAAHRPHHRRLPPGDRARLPPPRRRCARPRHQAVGPVQPRGARADLGLARAPTAAPLGHPQPALQDRAPRAHPHGDLAAHRGLRHLHPARRRGRAGRGRAVDLARLPARPVPLAPVKPPRRRLGRRRWPRGCASPPRCSRRCARRSASGRWRWARASRPTSSRPGA